MRDLIAQERFEIEVLDRLKSGRFLERMVFGGGTMLRLCHGLDRYSVDLDFWLLPDRDHASWFARLRDYLAHYYELSDAADKYHTLLVELKSPVYPRRLKVEMRKNIPVAATERAIAFSPHATRQVLVRALPLEAMMVSKIEAFLERKEIRDVYDLEFMVKKGVEIVATPEKAKRILAVVAALTRKDYEVKLGSLIEEEQRAYYREQNFRILIAKLQRKLSVKS
ncbi:MAG: nucleotidyl transferase AbiEii/AbiGii toxin family protein [Candidatus Omnitrophota bacterium]